MKKTITHFSLFLMLFTSPMTYAEDSEYNQLFLELKKMDDILFEQSFNQCHLEVLQPVISDDLEFYHDLGGFQNREDFLSAVKKNICSGKGDKPIRKLVSGSLKVYPLKNDGVLYGAIQNGEHEFYSRTTDGKLHINSIAKFTHLWLLKEGQWKLKRVLSYDHRPVTTH